MKYKLNDEDLHESSLQIRKLIWKSGGTKSVDDVVEDMRIKALDNIKKQKGITKLISLYYYFRGYLCLRRARKKGEK